MDRFYYHTFYCSLNMYVSQRIKEIREPLDMTQADVALRLGMSRQAYSKIENNVTHITVDVLDDLCNIFHVGLSEFFPYHMLYKNPDRYLQNTAASFSLPPDGYSTNASISTSELLRLITGYTSISPEHQKAVLDFIQQLLN